MRFSKSLISSIGYELAPVVVTSDELEDRLAPVCKQLKISRGQLEYLTGIRERRWWEPETPLSQGAIAAAKKALDASGLNGGDLGMLVYTGVCRENYEPATACRVGHGIGVNSSAAVFDIGNACLGVINGILEVANRIELGQIRCGMVVSCESSREINEVMMGKLTANPSMELFSKALATFTGGSGAVAVLLTDGTVENAATHRLLGGTSRVALKHHALCRWGVTHDEGDVRHEFMSTDSVSVLKHGVALGEQTWAAFLQEMNWSLDDVDRVICHQVGSEHQKTILQVLQVDPEMDFTTFEFLGNMGTVSLPLTTAMAEERGRLKPGQRVALLGIGSGLNCLMLGIEW